MDASLILTAPCCLFLSVLVCLLFVMNDRKFMKWFLLLTRASELYLVPFLLLNVYRYVCTFDTEDMTTGTGTCNSVLGTLVRDSPNTLSGQVPT